MLLRAFDGAGGPWSGWDASRGRNLPVPRSEADIAMERYASGDDAAFALVYDGLASRLYGFLLRQTRDKARAEDILQQTLLQIHRARARFLPGAEVTPWAFAIARRLLVDSLRRGKREVLTDDGELDPGKDRGPAADELVQARELAERIDAVLARLPESREVGLRAHQERGPQRRGGRAGAGHHGRRREAAGPPGLRGSPCGAG